MLKNRGRILRYTLVFGFVVGILLFQPLVSGDENETLPYHPGQVLVKLKKELSIHKIQKEQELPRMRIKHEYSLLGRLTGSRYLLLELGKNEEFDVKDVVDRLADAPGIEAASLNVTRRLMRIPNDPLFEKQWGLHNLGQQAYLYKGVEDIDIDAPESWIQADGQGQPVVAVIDTGLDLGHPDLVENTWINPNELPNNGIDDDSNGYIDDISGYDFAGDSTGANDPFPVGYDNHGTHVAGIIGASVDNGVGVAGVGLNAKIMILKIFHPASDRSILSDELEAFEYALTMKKHHNVNIVAINCSYGSVDFSALERDVISQCNEAGIAVVCAAGNGDENSVGYDIDQTPLYPASLDLPNIIAVAAIDNQGKLGDFSNFGKKSVDIAAPGVGVMSTFRRGNGSEATITFGGEQLSAFSLDFGGKTNGVTGLFYDCAKGISINDFPPGVKGNIALIQRGDVYFSQKVTNAQIAGAIAAVIYNDQEGNFSGTLQEDNHWIPALSISREDGLRILRATILSLATVINRSADYDFKSGTSMAVPFVCGALALLSKQFPDDDMNRSIPRLLLASSPLDNLQSKTRFGAFLKLPHSAIHAPTNARATLQANESFFTTEYIVNISFQSNPLNQAFDIQRYRVYRAIGAEIDVIGEIPAFDTNPTQTYSIQQRRVKKGIGVLYVVIAVDRNGKTGRPAFMPAE